MRSRQSPALAAGPPLVTAGPGGLVLERGPGHVCLTLPGLWRTCGNAPLCGGLSRATRLFILKVGANLAGRTRGFAPPQRTLADYAKAQGWSGPSVGLMTAAELGTLGTASLCAGETRVSVAVTAGLANARRAGDPADWRPDGTTPPAGTINILAVTDAHLTDAALAEALMILTEAKAAILGEQNITSTLTGRPATGTGTDCTVVASGPGSVHRFCGKHVPLGEILARTAMHALRIAIRRRT
ncbi:hypothetical protein JCM15519_32370 [Fundidesulfovibrio butyratiphilus]